MSISIEPRVRIRRMIRKCYTVSVNCARFAQKPTWYSSGIERCTLHDLRRTFISHLAMAGVNEAVGQKLAGHAQLSTTLEHYTRIMPDALRSAQARLPFGNVFGVVPKSYRKQNEEENADRRTDQEFA